MSVESRIFDPAGRLMYTGDMMFSIAEPFQWDTKANSMKIFKWKCLNDDHPEGESKYWSEICRKRVLYRWCPVCSPRCRDGRKCQECDKQATYNYLEENGGAFCVKHKTENMVDVKHPKCLHPGCLTRPSYNLPGHTKGKFCVEHKMWKMVNVEDPRCSRSNCLTRAGFGIPGHKPIKCFQHIEDGMVSDPTKRCTHPKCKEYAVMGASDSHGEYCTFHAPSTYICLLRYTCKGGCGMLTVVDKEGYCTTCHPDSITRYNLGKQNRVINWLKINPETSDFSSIDQVLPQTRECIGSKMYRPDIAYQRDEGYYIIVEVDEKQHNTESYKRCDLPRMINLHQDIGAPVYFIRYNPDEYSKDGKKKNPTDNARKKTLTNWIKWVKDYAKEDKVTDGLHVLYLFYNEYDESTCGWETINPYDHLNKKI